VGRRKAFSACLQLPHKFWELGLGEGAWAKRECIAAWHVGDVSFSLAVDDVALRYSDHSKNILLVTGVVVVIS
jgi:hypothetical protein